MNKSATLAIIAAIAAPAFTFQAFAVEARTAQPVRPSVPANAPTTVDKTIIIDEAQTGGHFRGATVVMQTAPTGSTPIANPPPPSPIALLLPAVQKIREAASR